MKVTQLILSIHITTSEGALKRNPEVLVGNLPVGFQLRQPTIVDEPKTWIIHHNADYTHYSLYAKNVVVAPGVIGDASFNLLLPIDRKIERFTVLEVLNAVEGMWGKAKGVILHEEFEHYIAQIPLAGRELFFPEMRGEKPAAHCIANKNQLGAMLNFSRYPILATVSCLELGHECDTTINLGIPQKVKPAPVSETPPSVSSIPTPALEVTDSVSQPLSSLLEKEEAVPPPMVPVIEETESVSPPPFQISDNSVPVSPSVLTNVSKEDKATKTDVAQKLNSTPLPPPIQELSSLQKQEEVVTPPPVDAKSKTGKPSCGCIFFISFALIASLISTICIGWCSGHENSSYLYEDTAAIQHSDITDSLRMDSLVRCSISRASLMDTVAPDYSESVYLGEHEYVDLGLSVKWATCNVGADRPEDYGDYFAWGETRTKSYYAWVTYQWCRDSFNNLTKYNSESDYGSVDYKTKLESSDDAAHAHWGGPWRMPTRDEFTELCERCDWIWTTLNGVNGYRVKSKRNDRSIFLPAAGCCFENRLVSVGESVSYWSSSLSTILMQDAWSLTFDSSNVGGGSCSRDFGRSIRPVCP